jgi:hypothetical protein
LPRGANNATNEDMFFQTAQDVGDPYVDDLLLRS